MPKQQCAFVQYTTRQAAETAAEKTFNKLILGGRRLTIKWGRSQGRNGPLMGIQNMEYEPVPGLPGALPELTNNFFNLEPGHIPLPNIPPPPSLMMPQLFGPPPFPPVFFNPPQMPSFVPNPAVASGSTSAAAKDANVGLKPTLHYPSQDPSRLGATQISTERQE